MLSPQLRNKVHGLWTMFWSAGMTNPLVAVEQITYLLFLRQLERLDLQRTAAKPPKPSIYSSKSAQKCRWSYIVQDPSFKLLNDTVFPWLRGLEKWFKENGGSADDPLAQVTGRLDDAYFVLDVNKADTLARAVKAIDELFSQLDSRSANADIMGDIFEHLLDEIQSAGKNGQFRTPRQIIRFMVELLDPPVGSTILDPACGTGGFLVNTLLHWKRKHTDPETLRIEWDGTPHRTHGVLPEGLNLNDCFHGYDNDRTMVRIAWMNLILHDLEFPRISQGDSLSKSDKAPQGQAFDFVLANPPFTGNVDEGDLSADSKRFPRTGNGKKPITTKSELLFVWLILDLLKVGGRSAVVVPDGVLFGSTNAHRELRRQLLFENTLEAVISLPGGVFLPYAGVKTSILVFQKVNEKFGQDGSRQPGEEPRTGEVFFYEVQDEAFTLDQKRKERCQGPNDLYDAIEKFSAWRRVLRGEAKEDDREVSTALDYFQPDYWRERWRVVDKDFLRIFPGEASQEGQILGIQELFPKLVRTRDPEAAKAQLTDQARGRHLRPLLETVVAEALAAVQEKTEGKKKAKVDPAKLREEFGKRTRSLWSGVQKLSRDESLLDREYDKFGLQAMQEAFDAAVAELEARLEKMAGQDKPPKKLSAKELEAAKRALPELFAMLDGYDVWLRSVESPRRKTEEAKKPQLSWIVPVRAWAKLPPDGAAIEVESQKVAFPESTHDDAGNLRPGYREFLRRNGAFADDGTIAEAAKHLLEPACIEAADLNLSAGRHKPFVFEAAKHEKPAVLIRKLQTVHGDIQKKLGGLLEMVEGKE